MDDRYAAQPPKSAVKAQPYRTIERQSRDTRKVDARSENIDGC